jgi:hypothetical protein
MANTYISDLRHFLDEETGDLADMPGPALRMAMFFASIAAWATINRSQDDPSTNFWCWRRPGPTQCRGEILAERRRGSPEITWHCPLCGMNGVIRGWEGSLWDRRCGPE